CAESSVSCQLPIGSQLSAIVKLSVKGNGTTGFGLPGFIVGVADGRSVSVGTSEASSTGKTTFRAVAVGSAAIKANTNPSIAITPPVGTICKVCIVVLRLRTAMCVSNIVRLAVAETLWTMEPSTITLNEPNAGFSR